MPHFFLLFLIQFSFQCRFLRVSLFFIQFDVVFDCFFFVGYRKLHDDHSSFSFLFDLFTFHYFLYSLKAPFSFIFTFFTLTQSLCCCGIKHIFLFFFCHFVVYQSNPLLRRSAYFLLPLRVKMWLVG